MGINFTSDIDGATSGSGITKITVGGKTINLSEVGGSSTGSGVASGSFTPEENATSFDIETGIDFQFLFIGKKSPTINLGYRTYLGNVIDIEHDLAWLISTNSGGGSYAATLKTWTELAATTTETFAKNGTTFNVVLNTSGSLAPEEYVWYAW